MHRSSATKTQYVGPLKNKLLDGKDLEWFLTNRSWGWVSSQRYPSIHLKSVSELLYKEFISETRKLPLPSAETRIKKASIGDNVKQLLSLRPPLALHLPSKPQARSRSKLKSYDILSVTRDLHSNSRSYRYQHQCPLQSRVTLAFLLNYSNSSRPTPTSFTNKSHIFDSKQEEFRRDVRKESPQDRLSVETEVVRDTNSGGRAAIQNASRSRYPPSFRRIEGLVDKMSGFRAGDGKTMLHMAACDGDVALAYEMIRMGIEIDRKDRNDVTALLLSLAKLVIHRNILSLVTGPNFPSPPPGSSLSEALKPEYLTKRIECDARIATLLIEQHADVNSGAFGVTPMSLAAESGRWSIVEVLLYHGARRPRTDDLHFASTIEKSRYLSILSKTKTSASDPRPPRPCPCWSGKLLSECHAAEKKPYPDNFICRCGRKNRSFGECCGRRGIQVVEEWDAEDKWIAPSTIRMMRLPSAAEVTPEAWTMSKQESIDTLIRCVV
ncbi:hypothetical protein VNI00_012122 [Paramarasmius palmivorus]|uniref:Uncharacterized protein n=1 Tax=Paramarasmius palmivorus TaxID=297713 RepID=A0AAW0C7V3_9AGAR